MSSIRSVSPTASFSDLLDAAPVRAAATGMPPADRQPPADTRNTPTNKAVRDMVGLLEEAARHPEQIMDSTPAYRPIPLSDDEMTAGWNRRGAPSSKT